MCTFWQSACDIFVYYHFFYSLLQYTLVASTISLVLIRCPPPPLSPKGRQQRSDARRLTCAGEFFYQASCAHDRRRRLPMTQTLSREEGKAVLIGLENSFGSIILECHLIGVSKDLDYSCQNSIRQFVTLSFML